MDLSASDRDPVERLAEEFMERHRRGEKPDLAEYTTKYPQWADAIRDLFPALLMMEQMRPVSENVAASRTAGFVAREVEPGKKLECLGDYRILREVGRGGMGLVYEAVQESLGRHVALKVLPASAMLDSRQRQRFEREARASARLHHTNIVPVFGVGEHDGLLYYVMQFIQGQSLEQVLTELYRLHKSRAKSTERASSQMGADRGQMRTEDTGVSRSSAADIAAQLLSGQYALDPVAPRADGIGLSDIERTTPLKPEGRDDETLAGDTAGATIPSDQPQTAQPLPSTTLGLVLPKHPGTHDGSGSVSGLLTGSTSSLGVSRTFRHYAASVARIGAQVSDALHYAHGQGIVHRDVKPSNLLLDMQGTVWVTDFGLAKAADEQNLTHTGDVLGTLRYMAPERFAGSSDARSDIYALGLTLYEMLALRPAFEGSERNSLIRRVTTESPPALRKIDPRVPRDLETIITKAIEREPQRRYQTAGALGEDLRLFLDDKPIRARRIHATERVWRWSRRNPALAAMAAAILLLLATVAIGSSLAAIWYQNVARSEGLARAQADVQRREAEQSRAAAQASLVEAQRQRSRAEASFQQARAAVDESLIRISETDLLKVPALRPLRRQLIEAALKYYQDFVRERGNDPELRKDLAAAYTRVGRITADLGSREDALKSYRQAIGIQSELERYAPPSERPRALAELARSHQAVGRLARELNQHQEGETALARSEALWQQASDLEPINPELKSGLADCLNDSGALCASAGQLERAAQRYRDALVIQRKLVDDYTKHPQIAEFRHVLARQYLRMGGLRSTLKLAPDTFIHVLGGTFPLSSDPLFFEKQSQEILRGLLRDFPAHPNSSEFRRDLAEATESIAAFQAGKNQHGDAMRSYQQALAIREQLARENPTVSERQAELARAYSSLGNAHVQEQNWSLALPQLARAVERQRLVVMLSPGDEAQRASLSRLLGDLGRLETKLEHKTDAARDLGEARDLLAQVSSPGPDDLYDLAALDALQSALGGRENPKLTTDALVAFQKAIAAGFRDVERARSDPALDPLRTHPEFKDSLDRLARIRQGIVWVLDMEEAKAQAAREKKDMFIYFSGSDWCPWCVLFNRTVLTRPEFISEVPAHFVMVQLDEPMTKPKPKNYAKIHELKVRWQITGIPTVMLADREGKPFARFPNDTSEEARARYIDNLVAACKVRADRDLALARAKAAKGVERARHLDEALRVLPRELVELAYGDTVSEILALDASDAAGLRTRYEGSREAQVRSDIAAAFGRRDWAGVIALVSGLARANRSAGSRHVVLNLNDYYHRGTAYAALGQFEEAQADFARVLESMARLRPPWPAEFTSQYAFLLAATGRLDEFRMICEGLLELASVETDPRSIHFVLMSLRMAPSAVPDWGRAMQLAGKSPSAAARDPVALRVLGQIEYRAGRFADAIEHLNRAIQLYDADPRFQKAGDADGFFSVDGAFLAMAHHRLGQTEEARRRLEQVKERWARVAKLIEKDSANPRNLWYNRLATRLIRSEAEALLESAAATDDPVAETDRARAEIRLGQWDRALSHLNGALAHLPGDLRLKLDRGRCLARLGRQEQAAADFADVIRIKREIVEGLPAPGPARALAREELEALSEAYHDLAMTQREAGLLDDATATYGKIQALWPGHPQQLFRVARGLARCLPRQLSSEEKTQGAGTDSSRQELALDALKQAALAGFTDSRQTRVALGFEPLWSQPDYRTVFQQLERSEVLALTSGELRRYPAHLHHWVEGVAASRDGRLALSVGDDQKPRLWDVESSRQLKVFDGHGAPVYGAALTADGRRAVTSSGDGTLRVWDVGTGKGLRRIAAGSARDQKLALAPDGRHVLLGAADGTLALWDVETGQRAKQLSGSPGPALCVAISPDGRRAVSGGRDGRICLWDLASASLIKHLDAHRDTVWCLTFTSDGRGALSGGGDGRLIHWDLETGRPIRDFTGHWAPVRALAMLPGGRRIVSGGYDGRLIVWDFETGRELYRLIGPAGILSLDPLPDGRRVLTAEENGVVRLRDLSDESARFRDMARLGQWEQALALDPKPRDARLRLGVAWYRAQNHDWAQANADPSLGTPQPEGMGIRQIPLLDPVLERQLRSGRGPAARVILINLSRQFYIGYALDRNGRHENNFTLDVGEGFVLTCEAKDAFLMTEKQGKPLGTFVAGTESSLLVVTGSPPSAALRMPRDAEYTDLLVQAVTAHGPGEPAQAFLAQLEKQAADDPMVDRATADAYARWGLWDRAAAAFARRLDHDPTDQRDWLCAALLCLKRGDAVGHRRLCRRMLERFAATDDALAAANAASICLLSASKIDDSGRPEQLAERAVKAGGEPASLKRIQQAKALAEYRQGRHKSALECLEKSRALNAGPDQRLLEPESLFVAALAHYGLGHASEAAGALDHAHRLWARVPAPGQPDYDGPWTDWLVCDSLRSEAEGLISARSSGTASTTGPRAGGPVGEKAR